MALLEILLGEGAVTSVAFQLAGGMLSEDLFVYILNRWPGLSIIEANQLITLGLAARDAGEILAGSSLDQPQPLDAVPISPFVDDGDWAGVREQVAIEITIPGVGGDPDHPYMIIVPSSGLETVSQLLRAAVDELCRRARKSPEAFPDVDCDQVMVFDYEILSAVRAF